MPEHNSGPTAVTVDVVLIRPGSAGREVLLVRRANEPFAGYWALPGGFVDRDEDLAEAAHRELREETGLTGIPLQQFQAFGAPGRDPRGHIVSIAFRGCVPDGAGPPRAGSDARVARWFSARALPRLAFDHSMIIRLALADVHQAEAGIAEPPA